MAMKLNVGVIGLNEDWERRYLPALRVLSDRYQVRAVCEQVGHLATQTARELSAASVDGFRALSGRSDVDAVLLLAKQWYGSLPVLAACDAGKAIYCAAGFETDPGQADSLRRRVDSSGIAFMAEFPRRFAPATLRLKELIATRLGAPQLLFCHCRFTRPNTPARQHLGRPPKSSRDTLVELVDWCRYVVDQPPTTVYGTMHRGAGSEEEPDYQAMSLDFSADDEPGNGPLAQISYGDYVQAAWPEAVSFRPPAQLQVSCENGIAFVDLPSTLIWYDTAGRHLESLESERPVGELLLSNFHRSVTSLMRNPSSLEDAYEALRIVHRARESYHTGQRVQL